MVRAPMRSTRGAEAASGAMPSSARASTRARKRNGVPRVARRQASVNGGSGGSPERGLDEVLDRGSRQRREAHDLGRGIRGDRRQQVRLRPALARPAGDDERDVELLEPCEQEREVAQRRRVGPVRIVDDEAERALGREVGAQPVEPVQDRERRIDSGPSVSCARSPPGRLSRPAATPAAPCSQSARSAAAALGEHRLEQLPHDAEGEVALELGAARAQDAHVLRPRPQCARRTARPSCRCPPAPRRRESCPGRCAPARGPTRSGRAPRSARAAGPPAPQRAPSPAESSGRPRARDKPRGVATVRARLRLSKAVGRMTHHIDTTRAREEPCLSPSTTPATGTTTGPAGEESPRSSPSWPSSPPVMPSRGPRRHSHRRGRPALLL